MLTKKQHLLLTFIHRQIQTTGIAPSFDEMKDALELKSKSGVHRLVKALEERGFIRRLPHRARALEVLRVPEDAAGPAIAAEPEPQAAVEDTPKFTPRVVSETPKAPPRSTRAKASQDPPAAPLASDIMDLPVIGRIAAGLPAEAIETSSATMGVPTSLLRSGGPHFVLEVRGDSMIDAGIFDGDLAIVQSEVEAKSGDIIVALIAEESEATLKRLRRRRGSIALEAANPEFATKIYRPDQVQIQGRLAGLIRRY